MVSPVWSAARGLTFIFTTQKQHNLTFQESCFKLKGERSQDITGRVVHQVSCRLPTTSPDLRSPLDPSRSLHTSRCPIHMGWQHTTRPCVHFLRMISYFRSFFHICFSQTSVFLHDFTSVSDFFGQMFHMVYDTWILAE